MARPFENIADINDTKDLWKVAVRVEHKWSVISNNKEHFEMIFVDKHGCDIHVVVPTTYMAAYNDRFALDQTYTVSNFKVERNNLVFKPSGHGFMVKFTGGTIVSDVNKHEIQPKQHMFTSFVDIITGKTRKDMLIDIFGIGESIGYAQRHRGSKKLQVNLVLRDATNNTINCTLWETYAAQFFKVDEERVNTSVPIVIMLRYAKIKEEGQYPLSVTNTFHVTQSHINADLPAVKHFLESIPKETMSARLLSGALALPLIEIKKLKQVSFCATVVETKKLIASSFGWCYRACHSCPKAARGDEPPFICDNNHKTEAEIWRYKIEIEAVHKGVPCKFIFWDRECTDLLEISAAQMRDTMIQAGITDPLEFPLALDKMLDLELAFRVKWQPSWDSCSVVMLIKDKPFVQQLKAPWEHTQKVSTSQPSVTPLTEQKVSTSQPSVTPLTEQIKESVDEAKTDAAEECEILTDVEITSRHNPDPVTPTAKRHIGDGSNESTTVAGMCDGELSSTKLKKIIKLEKNI
ncbi:uncharacterized protein LOC131597723 [Vicia villosa]|uniref:uncharacterized protein LOC131597723 n=1 Tax=Vicia villosa TaxID=3911 RepID=UPI00273B2E14|nr:uncharacterized protein LOC131597723 [Vicia villosa]